MGTSRIFYILIAAAVLSGCGLENMASKYNTVNFTTTPPTLETHGGKVVLSLDATFTEKYFAKQATVNFTPVLVYNGGETAFKTITIQGDGKNKMVSKRPGKFLFKNGELIGNKIAYRSQDRIKKVKA